MSKILTTLALLVGLLFGGIAPAAASEQRPGPAPDHCETSLAEWTERAESSAAELKRLGQVWAARDAWYQSEVLRILAAQQQSQADANRLQRIADRRAATIQRLRAKLAARR
jgi:hypothetical protein